MHSSNSFVCICWVKSMYLTSRSFIHIDFAETAETVIAFHAFFRLIPRVWESCMGAATLLRAKRNTRLRLLFIWPSGKKDLIFIKNRGVYFFQSWLHYLWLFQWGGPHTVTRSETPPLLVCMTYYLNLRVHRIVDFLCQRCASQDFIRLGRVSLLAVTWTVLAIL